ncbi:hypothetical protein CC2G_005139 [Coprinopsis cinerea AmutBmut pab1-1]|nr:hypothetical protein CC2G_005139 [Coprinopsis cinerea AmutBmut pab1-1]
MPPFSHIPLKIKSELEQIANVVYEAMHNQYDLVWQLRSYYESLEDPDFPNEATRQDFFPPFSRALNSSDRYELILKPAFYRDKDEVPVAWHLPSILQPARATSLFSAVQQSMVNDGAPFTVRDGDNWRSGSMFYRTSEAAPSGICTFFPLGFRSEGQKPVISSSFTEPDYNGTSLYDDLSETLSIVGAIVSLVDPSLFAQGLEFYELLHKQDVDPDDSWLFREVLGKWSTVFTSFSLYSNHSPPTHREMFSFPFAFETFVSTGFSEQNRFVLDAVGHEFFFRPGDVVVTFSHLFPHRWSSGEGRTGHVVGVALVLQ